MKVSREFYIPKHEGVVTLEFPDIAAVAYVWEKDGKFLARGFFGKADKPAFNYYFLSVEKRNQYLKGWVDGRILSVESKAKYKAERKAAKKSAAGTLVVGDILRNSWGYDQTNIDYFEVVEVKPSGKSVVIRKIGYSNNAETSSGSMYGKCSPAPGKFVGEPMTKLVQASGGSGACVKIHSWGSYAYKCDRDDVSNWSSYA